MTPPTDAAVLGGITAESKEYFEKRSLKKGAVNWVLLMSLGIAYEYPETFPDGTTA